MVENAIIMTPSNTNPEHEVMPGGTGPGTRLQAARIEQSLSVEDLANRMHLNASIIRAIEENDFEEITAPIFVKGYLRAYARIVKLNEDEVIKQYLDSYSNEDPPIITSNHMASEISSDDARVKWTTYLVILGLLVLLAVWWWKKDQNKSDLYSLDAQPAQSERMQDSAQAPLVEQAVNGSVAFGFEQTFIEPAPAGQVVAPTEITAPVPKPEVVPVSTLNAGAEVLAPAAEEIELEVQAQQTQIPAEPSARQSYGVGETAEGVSTQRQAPMGSDSIDIIVHADTWADIKDSGGHRLVYDLLRASQTVKVTGMAPFAVFFGNGHGVELSFNREPIDISSFIRDDNTARLKIGS